jgi:hypothetical protein
MGKAVTRTFTREQLLEEWEILDDPVSDRIVSRQRWANTHEVIFQAPDDQKFYATSYSRGHGDDPEMPWQYEKTVTAIEVHQVEKTIKAWEPVAQQ